MFNEQFAENVNELYKKKTAMFFTTKSKQIYDSTTAVNGAEEANLDTAISFPQANVTYSDEIYELIGTSSLKYSTNMEACDRLCNAVKKGEWSSIEWDKKENLTAFVLNLQRRALALKISERISTTQLVTLINYSNLLGAFNGAVEVQQLLDGSDDWHTSTQNQLQPFWLNPLSTGNDVLGNTTAKYSCKMTTAAIERFKYLLTTLPASERVIFNIRLDNNNDDQMLYLRLIKLTLANCSFPQISLYAAGAFDAKLCAQFPIADIPPPVVRIGPVGVHDICEVKKEHCCLISLIFHDDKPTWPKDLHDMKVKKSTVFLAEGHDRAHQTSYAAIPEQVKKFFNRLSNELSQSFFPTGSVTTIDKLTWFLHDLGAEFHLNLLDEKFIDIQKDKEIYNACVIDIIMTQLHEHYELPLTSLRLAALSILHFNKDEFGLLFSGYTSDQDFYKELVRFDEFKQFCATKISTGRLAALEKLSVAELFFVYQIQTCYDEQIWDSVKECFSSIQINSRKDLLVILGEFIELYRDKLRFEKDPATNAMTVSLDGELLTNFTYSTQRIAEKINEALVSKQKEQYQHLKTFRYSQDFKVHPRYGTIFFKVDSEEEASELKNKLKDNGFFTLKNQKLKKGNFAVTVNLLRSWTKNK